MKEQELKPCPFCAGLGVLISTGDIPKNAWVWVQCNDCGAQGPRFKHYPATGTKTGADLAWDSWKKRAASEADSVALATDSDTGPWHPSQIPVSVQERPESER